MTKLLDGNGTPNLLELVGGEGTLPQSVIAFSLRGDDPDLFGPIGLSPCG